MGFSVRKPFARRQTEQAAYEDDAGSSSGPQYDSQGNVVSSAAENDEAISSSVSQLKKFKKTHQWDYNLDYETIVGSPLVSPTASPASTCRGTIFSRPAALCSGNMWPRLPARHTPCMHNLGALRPNILTET